jgi:hypothetical protein
MRHEACFATDKFKGRYAGERQAMTATVIGRVAFYPAAK